MKIKKNLIFTKLKKSGPVRLDSDSKFSFDFKGALTYFVLANALLSGMGSSKDWNKEFQLLLELPDNVDKFKRLRHLSNDFLYVGTGFPFRTSSYHYNNTPIIATSCAKIIISELFSDKKTITPITIGGPNQFLRFCPL